MVCADRVFRLRARAPSLRQVPGPGILSELVPPRKLGRRAAAVGALLVGELLLAGDDLLHEAGELWAWDGDDPIPTGVRDEQLATADAVVTLLTNWVNTNGENLLFRVVQDSLAVQAMDLGVTEPRAILEFNWQNLLQIGIYLSALILILSGLFMIRSNSGRAGRYRNAVNEFNQMSGRRRS